MAVVNERRHVVQVGNIGPGREGLTFLRGLGRLLERVRDDNKDTDEIDVGRTDEFLQVRSDFAAALWVEQQPRELRRFALFDLWVEEHSPQSRARSRQGSMSFRRGLNLDVGGSVFEVRRRRDYVCGSSLNRATAPPPRQKNQECGEERRLMQPPNS